MIDVKQEDDGTLTISWDENDPQESILNTWTEEDFINAIQDKCKSLQELGEADNATEAVNQVTDYFIDQTPEEVQQDIRNAQEFIEKKEYKSTGARLFF
jgi:chaperonin cofactor prefoldin